MDGIAAYLSDEVHEGRPVKARLTWSRIRGKTARWEQAFSTDGGASWETNWVMRYLRTAPTAPS